VLSRAVVAFILVAAFCQSVGFCDEGHSDLLYRRFGVFTVPLVCEGVLLHSLLDTGSEACMIDDDLWENTILQKTGASVVRIRPLHMSKGIVFSKTMELRNGLFEESEDATTTAILDLGQINKRMDAALDAVAGLTVILQSPIELNGRTGTVTRLQPKQLHGPEFHRLYQTEYVTKNGLLTVKSKLPILESRDFVIDTGMTAGVAIEKSLLHQMVRSGVAVRIKEAGQSMNVDGTLVEDEFFRLKRFEFGGIVFHNVKAVVGRHNAVGMRLLRFFRMIIDPTAKVVFLDPSPEASTVKFAPNASGFGSSFNREGALIVFGEIDEKLAGRAGLKPGDEILAIDEKGVDQFRYFDVLTRFSEAGTTLKLKCRRDGKEFEIEYQMEFPYPYPPEWPPEKEEFNP
jgi:hypothetical protein